MRLLLLSMTFTATLVGCAGLDGPPYVAQGWGAAKLGGRVYSGWDLNARVGTPVYAPRAGVVTMASHVDDMEGQIQQWPKLETTHDNGEAPGV